MADPTTPLITDEQVADAIRVQLANRAAAGTTGVISVTIDGVATTYNEQAAREALEYWEKRAERAGGRRRRVYTVDLRGAF